MDDYNSEMGSTSGKGLALSFCRGDLEDGGHNEHIGDKDEHKRDQQHQNAEEKDDHFLQVGVCAAQFEDRENVTKEVADAIGGTEGNTEHQHIDNHRDHETTKTGGQNQQDAGGSTDNDHVVERIADGNIAIVAHHSNEKAVGTGQAYKEIELSSTARERNSWDCRE